MHVSPLSSMLYSVPHCVSVAADAADRKQAHSPSANGEGEVDGVNERRDDAQDERRDNSQKRLLSERGCDDPIYGCPVCCVSFTFVAESLIRRPNTRAPHCATR